jgi:hypothetical protein
MYSMEAESDCFPQNKTKTASIVLTPVSVGTENSTQSIQDVGSCRQTVQWSVTGATHSRRCRQKPWTRQCLSTCMLRPPLAPCGLPLRYVALFSSRFLWLTGYHPDTGAGASFLTFPEEKKGAYSPVAFPGTEMLREVEWHLNFPKRMIDRDRISACICSVQSHR